MIAVGDHVIVETITQERVTQSGIVIPDIGQGRIGRGVVRHTSGTTLKDGDEIVFGGVEETMDVSGKRLFIVNLKNVYAILNR